MHGHQIKSESVFKYQMLWIIEALESAASITKDPKDVIMIDLDNQGKCKITTKEQIDKAEVRKNHKSMN